MKTKLLRLPLLILCFFTLLFTACKKDSNSSSIDNGVPNAVSGTYKGTFKHDLMGNIDKKLVLKTDMTAMFYETIKGSTQTFTGTYTFTDTQVIHTFKSDAGMATTIYTRVGNNLDEAGICLMTKQ